MGGSLYRDGFFPGSLIIYQHLRRLARTHVGSDAIDLPQDQVVESALSSSGAFPKSWSETFPQVALVQEVVLNF